MLEKPSILLVFQQIWIFDIFRKTLGEYNKEISGNMKIPKAKFKQDFGEKSIPDKDCYMGQMS